MKLSLAWLFDHIDSDRHAISLDHLVAMFNAKVAEIDGVERVSFDPTPFVFVTAKEVQQDRIVGFCPELKQTITLPVRTDAVVGKQYLAKREDGFFVWAAAREICEEKERLLPAFSIAEDELSGGWRDKVEREDVILEVDNTSLTNRPDMWGHRGFAREVAALFDLPLKDEAAFLAKIPIRDKPPADDPFTVKKEAAKCNRFATLYLPKVESSPSHFWMALRLLRVGTSAIDAIVDATNYTMLDIGQPMHAFDAKKLVGNTITVRNAQRQEKMVLLDGEEIELVEEDMVIADKKGAVSLAGIMGGLTSGVSDMTEALLLESAHFDPTTIRRSAARHKVRTEASARFEKMLDPNQNIFALERFVQLLNTMQISYERAAAIVSLGEPAATVTVRLTRAEVAKKLGVEIPTTFIKKSLEKLGFVVGEQDAVLTIAVPTWRSSKDVTIKEDVIEEVARLWGYDKIPKVLPAKKMIPATITPTLRVRKMKQQLAFGAHMHEVQNYPFYDESFLQQIKWQPNNAVRIVNPVSGNWQQLVTSLIPHLCKNIAENSSQAVPVNVFEWGRCWQFQDGEVVEVKKLSGVRAFIRGFVDFYQEKQVLDQFFKPFKIPVVWRKVQEVAPWFSDHQTAALYVDDQCIGYAGMLAQDWLAACVEATAFGFELDGAFLQQYQAAVTRYVALPKYQSVSLDVSIFVPLSVTVAQAEQAISFADDRIYEVALIDHFMKDEWEDKKSLTLRYSFVDRKKTVTSDEIHAVQQAVELALEQQCKAHIR